MEPGAGGSFIRYTSSRFVTNAQEPWGSEQRPWPSWFPPATLAITIPAHTTYHVTDDTPRLLDATCVPEDDDVVVYGNATIPGRITINKEGESWMEMTAEPAARTRQSGDPGTCVIRPSSPIRDRSDPPIVDIV